MGIVGWNLKRRKTVQLQESVVARGVQGQRMVQMKRATKHVHLGQWGHIADGGGGKPMIQRPTKAKSLAYPPPSRPIING